MPFGDTEAARLRVVVEALGSDLRATEASLAHWRTHASNLHRQLRACKHAPDESLGAPRSLLPLVAGSSSRPRELSCSSLATHTSFASTSTYRGPRFRSPVVPEQESPLEWLRSAFSDPKEADASQWRDLAVSRIQAAWRGARQRQHYAAARAFFAVVNGVVELHSGGRSVPAYTLTVVRGGHCWQVHHRFSDWLELDKQLCAALPYHVANARPSLPSRVPFRTSSVTSHRQYALNRYLTSVLSIVLPFPRARRTLLNFVSRSHMHWTYANDAVLLAPTLAARAEEVRARQGRELAQAMLVAASDPPMHQVPYQGRDGPEAHAGSVMNGHADMRVPVRAPVQVHNASTGATSMSSIREAGGPPRGLLG